VPRHLLGDRPPTLHQPGPPLAFPTTVTATPRHASTTEGGRRPRKGGRGGGSSSRGGTTGRGGGQSWLSFYNPWTDTIFMWPGQTPGASRPLTPTPALLIMPPAYGVPPYDTLSTTPTPPSLQPMWTSTTTPWSLFDGGWDPNALASTYITMALAPPSSD
jgi:hypothetical protein